jgi:RNA polymerase sigma-70 factor (ECF subfamily)
MSDAPVSDFPGWTTEMAGLHDQPLRRYAYSLCRDWDLANDAVQSTWLRFYRSKRGEVEPKIPAWLFLVCRRQVIDFLRRKGRMIEQTNEHEAVSHDAAPVTVAENEDASSVLFAQIEFLPPAQREVLRLKFQGGLSYAEIGDVTDRTANAVGVLIHMAIRSLRERVRLHTDLIAN